VAEEGLLPEVVQVPRTGEETGNITERIVSLWSTTYILE